MNSILYIKASPRTGRSHSIVVADAFIEAYRQINPVDEIETIDIFDEPIPPFDLPAVTAKYMIMHGEQHSPQNQRIWSEVVAVIEQFKSADKYVMAVPMWNFSIPYRLKQYIDIIVQPTYTFSLAQDGSYQGLVKDKPIFIAYARGGEYPTGTDYEAFDLQKKYLELILAFIGFSNIRSVVVEPTLAGGADIAEQRRNEAVERARQIAQEF